MSAGSKEGRAAMTSMWGKAATGCQCPLAPTSCTQGSVCCKGCAHSDNGPVGGSWGRQRLHRSRDGISPSVSSPDASSLVLYGFRQGMGLERKHKALPI